MKFSFSPTIKMKLFMMGLVAVVALASLSFISMNAGNAVARATNENHVMLEQSQRLSDLRVSTIELVLAAMDSIIDADEGYVYDERLEVMDSSIDALRDSQELIQNAADRIGQPELAAEIAELTNTIDRVVRQELVQAIEARAGEEAYAGFDDDIDEFGEGLVDILAEMEDRIGVMLRESGTRLSKSAADSSQGAITAGLVFVTVLIAFLYVTGSTITKPIAYLTTVMEKLADGDLEVEVETARRDELGKMAVAVQVFKDNAGEKIRLEQEQEASKQRAEEEKRQTMMEMADRFERQVKQVVDGVSSSATEMQATAQQMSATAEETTQQSASVAAASDEATANVQTVAATAEELSASIAEIGRQVNQSATIAANAVDEAEATNSTVQGLAEAASKIGDVVKLINEIAGQTNLLALNATIEAARAGEAGKGFAVVAGEVKNLANQTAKATQDISDQITAIQDETNDAVGAIERIRDVITEVNEIATTIATAVEQQGVSTQEIARNVMQAARGTQEVNQNIENVSKAAGETGTAAGQVLTASQEMSRQAEGLRGEVDKFLQEVRAS
ncbi:MAG: HAMP domain-containing protein [Proteobacteria bacterium]|nr:HAMP domain-containing protein [Pseudomonadota bacterium]MCK4867598.1 HAMP domain-containing protein [Alphaproteobacteria bacterium]